MFDNGVYSGPAYKYDVVSMYPSIMNSQMRFPIRTGQFMTITNEELHNKEYLGYGIYRCNIMPSNDKYTNNLFRFNKKHYYTHFDINRARELQFGIEMIEDEQCNFLYYAPNTLITGHELFGKFVEKMYGFKCNDITGSKNILNCLWGALCQSRIKKSYVKHDEEYDTGNGAELFMIKPSMINKNENIIRTKQNDKQYIFGYGRIKSFLLASARVKFSKIIEPYKKSIVYGHTDGMVMKYKPDDIKIGNALGDLKFEGKLDDYWITNMANYNKSKFMVEK
jgi:hypothetical protein